MTDEDFEWCDVCEDCDCYKAIGDFKYRCMLEGGRCKGYFAYKKLEAENAAMRKQISEMVMPPCTLGDTLYIVVCTFGDGYVEDEIVHQGGFGVVKSVVTEKNFYRMCDLVRNGKAFFSQEAAERELEELVGKCRCKFDRELEDKE